MSNVKGYTDAQIIERVKNNARGFDPGHGAIGGYPTNYWLVGVRSDEDEWNKFDDKFYLFKGMDFVAVWKGTTNAGTDLLNPTNRRGEAILQADNIWYDSHTRGLHRGKVMAYRQAIELPIHRDDDHDRKIEELGEAHLELVGINIHPSSYIKGSSAERPFIGPWSQGCQVFAVRKDFDRFMDLTEGQQRLTYCLLNEW